jgi:hypothetical protein
MNKLLRLFVPGVVVGVLAAALVGWMAAPRMMLAVHQSRLGFDDTVAAIQDGAVAHGWKVSKDLRCSEEHQRCRTRPRAGDDPFHLPA